MRMEIITMRRQLVIPFVLFLFVILYAGCKTNPPVETAGEENYQEIFLQSDVSGAAIFIDDVPTGRNAPQTLKLLVGEHRVKLVHAGSNDVEQKISVVKNVKDTITIEFTPRTALLEDFANVSCSPCVASNIMVERLKEFTYDDKKLVVVKFATSFPSPADPFYLTIPEICAARKTFYAVSVAPTLVVSGTQKFASPDSFSIKSAIQQSLAVPKQLKISSGTFKINGSDFTIDANVTCLNPFGIDFSKMYVHLVLVEKRVEYPTPPGNNGEKVFYNVVRAQLPGKDGQAMGNMTANQVLHFSAAGVLQPAWLTSQLSAVVFLQNKTTKEVYNAGIFALTAGAN